MGWIFRAPEKRSLVSFLSTVLSNSRYGEWRWSGVRPMGSIERFAFYQEARKAFGVVATGEPRGYGCFLLKKGVILPE